MGSHITIRDIANLSDVSTATVSRYLNGKYEFMSEKTRVRIESVIQRTGYRPNKLAGSLKTARSNTIGLVLSNPTTNLTPFLVSSICNSCTHFGQKTMVIASNEDEEIERKLAHELIDQQVDGLIVATGANTEFYENLSQRYSLPIVLIDRVPNDTMLDWVAINHYVGTATVINHLISQGFDHIVLVVRTNRSHRGTIALREQSAEESCFLHFGNGNHYRRVLISEDNFDTANRSNDDILMCLSQSYSKSDEHPTAIFIADGSLMGRFVCGVSRLGLELSSRFMLAGYDIWNFGNMLPVPICTIDQPLSRMGTVATELLVSRITQGPPDPPQTKASSAIHELLDCQIFLSP